MAGCASEADTPAALAPAGDGPVVNEDHWHAAVGVYVCDRFVPDIAEFESGVGVHTHGDGVIHIHPFTAEGAGRNATLGLFLDEAVVEADDGAITVDGETYEGCDGEGSVDVQFARWDDVAAGGEPDRVVDDPDDLQFTATGEGYTVALMPEGADIPPPPTADQLEELGGTDGPTDPSEEVDDPALPDDEGPVSAPGLDVPDGFLAVLTEAPSPGPGATCPPGQVGSLDTGCYELSEDGAVGLDAVASAEAAVDLGQWGVQLTLTDDGIDAFNRLAAACFAAESACPSMRVAIVVAGEVVSAPSINAPSFEADQIQISGSFTEAQAETIAQAMTG